MANATSGCSNILNAHLLVSMNCILPGSYDTFPIQALFFPIGKHWRSMSHPPVTHTFFTKHEPAWFFLWCLLDHHKHNRHFHQWCQENWEYVSLLLLPLLPSWLLLQQQNKRDCAWNTAIIYERMADFKIR